MAELRRKRGPMHDINVVPYIDVMLVLLVIFMVTAPRCCRSSSSARRRTPSSRC